MADATRYLAEVEVALLLMTFRNLTVVSNYLEVVSTQSSYLADTCHEVYLGIAWEGAQYLAFGQVKTVDGYVTDGLLRS